MTKTKWIKCSERLPEESGYYLTTSYYSPKEEENKDLRKLAICWYDTFDKGWQYSALMTVVVWIHELPEVYMGDI